MPHRGHDRRSSPVIFAFARLPDFGVEHRVPLSGLSEEEISKQVISHAPGLVVGSDQTMRRLESSNLHTDVSNASLMYGLTLPTVQVVIFDHVRVLSLPTDGFDLDSKC